MEASENIPPVDPGQLAFEPSSGAVRALGDRLVIESLTVSDGTAARVVRERAEAGQGPIEAVAKMVEIGARVLDREETAADLDYVRREVESMAGQIEKKLGGTIEAGSEAIAEELTKTFGGDQSVQAQIRETVSGLVQQTQTALLTTLTAEDASNPLVAMQLRIGKASAEAEERHRAELERLREGHGKEAKSMRAEMAGLKQEVARLLERDDADERVAEAEAAGTRKGFSFEERVHAAVERIANVRGDCATHTGAEGAEGGGKKGDTLVELGAASGPATGRIVFEAKDRKLSKNDAWKELNRSMAVRAASFGVLVVAGEDRVPSGSEQLVEYGGDKMIIAVDRDDPDPLGIDLAYRLAAARVLLARDADLEVDAIAVRDTAAEALALLKQAQAIRSALTGIKTSSDKARQSLDAMVEALEDKLQRIDSLVAEAADEEASAD